MFSGNASAVSVCKSQFGILNFRNNRLVEAGFLVNWTNERVWNFYEICHNKSRSIYLSNARTLCKSS